MHGGIQTVKVVEVLSQDDFAHSGGAEFQHVLIGVPRFLSFAELVEDREGYSAFVVPRIDVSVGGLSVLLRKWYIY
jgi:hypothetical protein